MEKAKKKSSAQYDLLYLNVVVVERVATSDGMECACRGLQTRRYIRRGVDDARSRFLVGRSA